MKKISALLLSAVTAVSLAACKATPVPSQTAQTESKEDIRIAMVSDTVGTEQFILQAFNALKESSEKNGFQYTSLECSDNSMYLEKAQGAAEEGYDLIVGVGWAAGDPFAQLADQYPDTRFAVIDTIAANDKVTSIGFNEAEGAYILGAMVATAFPDEVDHTFGYVSSFQTYATYKYRWGFLEGLKSVMPDAKIDVLFTNSYSDTSVAYTDAKNLSAKGYSFIMGGVAASANEGIYKAAMEDGFYTSGLSVDQTTEENPYLTFGLLKNTGNTMNYIVDHFLDGTLEAGEQTLGVKEGGFGVYYITKEDMKYSNEEILTEDVMAAGRKAYDDIMNGTVTLIAPEEK